MGNKLISVQTESPVPLCTEYPLHRLLDHAFPGLRETQKTKKPAALWLLQEPASFSAVHYSERKDQSHTITC